MNFEFFIASRISYKSKRNFSKYVVRIALVAIILSVAVMLVSVSIVKGFKDQIRDKVIGFSGHVQVTHAQLTRSYESTPIKETQQFYQNISKVEGVSHVQPFATKPAILKADEDIEGVVLKGITGRFNRQYISKYMVKGSMFELPDSGLSNKTVISEVLANRLQLEVGQRVYIYFVQDPPRVRALEISGIYNTGLEEIDKLFIYTDIRILRQINGWDSSKVGGFEVFINNYDRLDEITEEIHMITEPMVEARSIKQNYPQIFDWLDLLNVNVRVILSLMVLVASINMITALLIMILERTQMVGILKSLGASNMSLQTIFVYTAGILIFGGIIGGNILGLGLLWLQDTFHLMKLPQESYYVSEVPVVFDLLDILLINAGTLLVCGIVMFLPSILVTNITPLKALRFK